MSRLILSPKIRIWPCQNRTTQKLFQVRVSAPTLVVLPLHEIYELVQSTDILAGKRNIKLIPMREGSAPLKIRGGAIFLDTEAIRAKNDLYGLPVEKKVLLAELEAKRSDLKVGRHLYYNLLEIDVSHPDQIIINQSRPRQREPLSLSSGENLLRGGTGLTVDRNPHEAISELLDPNLKSVIQALSEDHPAFVKRAIINGKFASVVIRQNHECLKQVFKILCDGVVKLEALFLSEDLKSLYPFLPSPFKDKITEIFMRNNHIVRSGEFCQHLDKWNRRLNRADREEIAGIFSDAKTITRSVLERARYEIERRGGSENEIILRNLICALYRNNLFEVLLPSYVDAVTATISESRRKKTIRDIRESNFLENVKELLTRILDEKRSVYIAMYSFTSPLFAAACIATALRGAAVKILLDPSEAKQESSQYENFISHAERLSQKFGYPIPLEVRTFRGVQHLKNILLASNPTATSGSQNLSDRGLTRQLEDVTIFDSPVLYQQKAAEFETFFNMSGSFVPLPESLLSRPWIRRSGIQGVEFSERRPYPAEINSLFNYVSRLRTADFTKLPALYALLREQGAELVIDLNRSFHNFLAVIHNPEIVDALLPSFLKTVPQEFSFAAASSSGKMHPGTTSGLSGLIEHVNITCELAVKICRILGREDLVETSILAVIVHDTYKNATKDGQGNIVWGRYNPSHGQLAAEKLRELFFSDLTLRQQNALNPAIGETLLAVGEHMSIFNKPTPTPLKSDDPALKFAMVLADMLASRKYLYVNHRASLPYERDEIIHFLLNNSFSIEGEALNQIHADAKLFGFVQEATKDIKPAIENYPDLPVRTKQILRVAESLCDLFPAFKEVFIKKGAEPAPEDRERIAARNEILSAAVIFGTLRYLRGIEDPNSKVDFDKRIEALKSRYSDPSSRERKILDLVSAVEGKLKSPKEAALLPSDLPELWILCMANCIMTAEDVWVVTSDDVEFYLQNAKAPKTIWAQRKTAGPIEDKLAADLQALVASDYISEYLPFLEAGLLSRFNSHRKIRTVSRKKLLAEVPEIKDQLPVFFRNPDDETLVYKSNFKRSVEAQISSHLLKKALLDLRERSSEEVPLKTIPGDVLAALVKKYNSLSPDQIFRQFYSDRDKPEKDEVFEILIDAARSAEARADLIGKIEALPDPKDQTPSAVYRLAAKTLLANNISSIDRARNLFESANNLSAVADYSYFRQMETAVEYLFDKINVPEEKILVYGDYDVDGLTSTALLIKTLRWVKAKELSKKMDSKKAQEIAKSSIGYYIPNRVTEGYGLNAEALQRIYRNGYKTIITADCGIRDRELVRLAKKMGINIVITDHHNHDARSLPRNAVAIINPKVELKPDHPAYYLVGAGVAYKLARALADKAGIDLRDSFLDSVALASIADIVPMTGENRAFVKAGLKRLNSPKRNRGLSAIIKAMKLERVDEEALAFFVAPVLNVSGRFGNAYKSLGLLMPKQEKELSPILSELFAQVEDRRDCEQAIMSDLEKNLNFDPGKSSGIIAAGVWHKGMIGLVASKVVQRYGVPSALIALPSQGNDPATGSMRTIKGVSAVKILHLCAKQYKQEKGEDLFIGFGGHSGAAGFRISVEKIEDFKRIYDEVTRTVVKGKRAKMVVAGTIEEADIKLEDVKIFKQLLSPFGSHFEEPRFLLSAKIKSWQVMGKDHQHLRGYLEGGTPFVFFNGNQPWIKRILIQKEARFVVKLGINVYKGRESVQLVVEDLKSAKRGKE